MRLQGISVIHRLTLGLVSISFLSVSGADTMQESEVAATADILPRELTGFLDDRTDEYRAAAEGEPGFTEDGSIVAPPPYVNLPVIDERLAARARSVGTEETLRVIIHLDYLPHAAVFESVTRSLETEIAELEEDRQAFLQTQADRRKVASKVDAENYAAMFAMDAGERLQLGQINERKEALSLTIKNQVSLQLKTMLDANQAPVIAAISALGGNVEFTTIAANTIVATVPSLAIEELASVAGVQRVVLDSLMEAHLDIAASATMTDPVDSALLGLWDNGITGGIYDPAIIDSGIDLNHPGMADDTNRANFSTWYVVAGAGSSSYDETCCSIDDLHGHGTHVAGIVGSYGTPAWPTRLGMSHGVDKLVSLKAGWLNTSGNASMFWSDKYNVVDRALYNTGQLAPGGSFADDVDGMNLSYGGSTSLDDTDAGRFWDSVISTYPDLPVTISVGDGGPSNTFFYDPAVSYNAIAVASYNDRNTSSRADDIVSSSSTRGPTANGRRKPDIAAPGTSISAPNTFWETQSDYVDQSGSSMAAPMVLGVIMDLMDAGVFDEKALKALLINTAQKNLAGMNIEDDADGWDPALGWGAMNAYAAYFHRFDVFLDSVTERGEAGDFQLYKGSMRDEGAAGEGRDRATMVWNRAATYNTAASPTTYYDIVNLNLRLYRESDNVLLDFDTDADDNVHQVRIAAGASDTDVIINAYAWSDIFSHGGTLQAFALATEDGFTRVDSPTQFQAVAIWPGSVEPSEVFDIEFWLRNDSEIASHNNLFNLDLPPGWTLVSGTDTQNVGSAAAGGGTTAHVFYTLRAPSSAAGAQNIVVKHSHNSYNEPYGEFNWNMGVTVEVDDTPPNPNPMSFSAPPENASTSSILMTASSASDTHNPVEYFLQYMSSPSGGAGGGSSGWQSSRNYTDIALQTNHEYCYRAWARDNAISRNQTTPSPTICTYTSQSVPTGVSLGTATNTSIDVYSSSLPENLTLDSSGLMIRNVTAGTNSGWKQNNNPWTSTGLTPAKGYNFDARARNGNGDVTGDSPGSVIFTLANFPAVGSLTTLSDTRIRVSLNPNGNSSEAEYFVENTTAGTNSGWINSTSWTSTGLACNAAHNFQARARNGDGMETLIVPLGQQNTLPCPGVCPANLNLVGQAITGTEVFQATGKVTTQDVTIEAGAIVTFIAGQSVEFDGTLSIDQTADVTVIVDPGALTCSAP